jgi:hypothetical protein
MRIAGIGYAVPGGVIAVGILFPFAAFDNALDAFMEANFGIDTGLLITGSIWLMIAAYMVRFMAVALNTYEAGLATVNTNIDAVARTLGHGPVPMLRRVHVPILRPSILTALLIVFVDVMKELPATLILRPFNYDTLAVQAHRLAVRRTSGRGRRAQPRHRGGRPAARGASVLEPRARGSAHARGRGGDRSVKRALRRRTIPSPSTQALFRWSRCCRLRPIGRWAPRAHGRMSPAAWHLRPRAQIQALFHGSSLPFPRA